MGKSSTVPNADLEHSAGGATTRDPMDAGVPMTPGDPREPVGPEDAMGAGPKRGDYSDRLHAGPHMVTRALSQEERVARATRDGNGNVVELGPVQELVPAEEALEVGDAPGKGGVSTEAALAEAPGTPAHPADVGYEPGVTIAQTSSSSSSSDGGNGE